MNNANQPAYPQHGWSSNPETVARMQSAQGLTKRELIAAMALQGILSDPNSKGTWNQFAECAIEYADALLAKLQETEPK